MLNAVLSGVALTLVLCAFSSSSLLTTTLLFTFYFVLLGAGSGALFQLVPLRWPVTTAVVGSMVGELGTLGGSLIPNAMGQSRQITGSYFWGFIACAAVAAAMFFLLRLVQGRWTSTWVGLGGRARVSESASDRSSIQAT